jgi:hypothetical protein
MNSLILVTLYPLYFDDFNLVPSFWLRDLSYNGFSGPVPATIGDLEHLLELYAQNQPLIIHVSSHMIIFPNVLNSEYRNLSKNHLSGSVPAEFGNLRSVQVM